MQASLGLYSRRIFPWLNDQLNSDPELLRLRSETLALASGRTVEIGFGTGLNLAHYPSAVTELVAVEPNPGMLDRAAPRLADIKFPVKLVTGTAERLPFDAQTFDTAVTVLTLCTVDDPNQALGELRRVLRDDGRLLVLEHGLADDPGVARWQRRLDWLQSRVACGCHLTRPADETLARAGFRIVQPRRFFAPSMPRTHGWVTVGLAIKA